MGKRGGRVIVILLICAGALLASVGPAGAHDPSTLIASGEFTNNVSAAETDGTYVAWLYGADSPATSCKSLQAAPLTAPDDPTSVTIVRGASFDVSAGVLIWEHLVQECHPYSPVAAPGVYGLDLVTGQDYVVTTERTGELRAAGRTVVWSVLDDLGNTTAIRMAGLDGGDATTLVEFEPAVSLAQLRFDGERVAWLEQHGDDAGIVMAAIPGAEPVELLASGPLRWFDVRGSWLSWHDGARLQTRNLASGETLTLAASPAGGFSTDGRYVLWVDAPDFSQATLHAYDLQTASRFTVVNYPAPTETDTVGMRGSAIQGGVVAWDVFVYPSVGTQIRAARLSAVLPSARRPDPGKQDPNWNWFPETGHYLGRGFRDFWNANGGLPIFGYPLTEEFEEQGYTAQFTERQRFEWHPELAGTPYEVLLGRLGAEQAEDLGLLGSEPFQPQPIAGGEAPGCLYFPETLHYACAEFYDYWRTHGLEFGDPGATFRESLALFGFPLSEPFMTTNADGDTVLTQYFERAVFELHPDNPEPHRVLLRRLGAEVLAARDW